MEEKKYKNGLVLGKLNVFHLGHKYLIDTALQQCETVYVMVCSLKSEKTKGIDRFLMVANTYKNNLNVRIIDCRDENPQYPEECNSIDEFYNNYWVPTVRKYIKDLQVVFTSELYGDEFASYLGCEHVLVDLKRTKYNVSGTKVRNNILENWDLLPPATQKFFQKKICVVGPESTGKSILCEKLAKHYRCDYVQEYGRNYVKYIPTKMLEEWDFEVIAKNHYRLVEKAWKENKNMFLFVDTEAIVTKTFLELYIDDRINIPIQKYINCQNYDLYLLLTPETEHIDDGTRDFSSEKDRWKHFNMIQDELYGRFKNYVVIDGSDYTERYDKALNEIDKFIQI